jgi:UDP-galactopyranose mutase
MKLLVVGSGFAGAVIARELADQMDCEIDVMEERDHLGGNCHTARDQNTGVMVHAYGPHIFNTDDRETWDYVNRYGKFIHFVNRVKSVTRQGIFSMPINLHTINQFFGKTMSPEEARVFVSGLEDKTIHEPRNFEEQGLKMIGKELYETFYKWYTYKQWGCSPRELPPHLFNRLPIRFDYNDNYYNKAFQGIPEEGYTNVIQNILQNPQIHLTLNTPVFPDRISAAYQHVFWTGPLDRFFHYSQGMLGYRTLEFEKIVANGDYQGNAVMNYPNLETPFTRIHEHKHLAPWESHSETIAFREYPKEARKGDIPFYPKRLERDLVLLGKYQQQARSLSNVSFHGRLGTYRYMDMEAVIREARLAASNFIQRMNNA